MEGALGEQQRLGVLTRMLHSGKQALDVLSLRGNQALSLTILLVLWVLFFPALVRLSAHRIGTVASVLATPGRSIC
jgi:ACR3 family arsenite efflux pump ArsB